MSVGVIVAGHIEEILGRGYVNGVNTVIGFNSQGHYLYIGPPDHDVSCLDKEQWIEADFKKFTVDRSEKVYFKNEVVYIWAIIREIVEVE